MNTTTRKLRTLPVRLLSLAFFATSLSACGGAKVLKEPVPLEIAGPLASGNDEQLEAVIDWVIVRDGPGTWSRDAYWDEYLIRVANLSDTEVLLTGIEVIDALDEPVSRLTDRRQLERATRSVSKHYKKLGYDIAPGYNGGHMVVASAGAMVGGTGIMVAGLSGTLGGGGALVGAGALTATGLVLAAPVLLAGGLVKGVNNGEVEKVIQARQTALPMPMAAGEVLNLDLFFPVSPAPKNVRIHYLLDEVEYSMLVSTEASLRGLHVKGFPEQD